MLSEKLLKIDRFGVPLTLRVTNKKTFNTHFGSITTIILSVILIRSFISLMENLFTKGDPVVVVN